MEGRREVAGGRCHGGGDESDDVSSCGVELSLGLATGCSSPAPAATAAAREEEDTVAAAAAAARRSMTIFYNGRVCTVDVTDSQAMAIISMASQVIFQGDHQRRPQQQRGDDDRRRQDSDSGSGSSSSGMTRYARDGRLMRPAAAGSSRQGGVAAAAAAAAAPVGPPGQGAAAVAAAAPAIVQAAATGLSMKRSLQRFLQKRKARVDAAAAPPYAGGRQAQAMRH